MKSFAYLKTSDLIILSIDVFNTAERSVQWGFISKSMRARLQVSVCSGYDLCYPSWLKIDFYILIPVTLKSRSNSNVVSWCRPLCEMHLRCKCGDRKSVTCRDNTPTSIFYNNLKPRKVGYGDLFLLCNPILLWVCACKIISVFVPRLDTQTDNILTSLYEQLNQVR